MVVGVVVGWRKGEMSMVGKVGSGEVDRCMIR